MEESPVERAGNLPKIKLHHLVWVFLIYCAVVSAIYPRRTYDIWWHIAAGEWMVHSRQIPHEDPFTWTREGEPWTAHEWAWELPMYALYSRWGHDGLMVLRVLVAGAAGALLAWLCLRRGAPPLAVIAVGALAIFAARPLFNDRPQIATTALFVAMLCLIQQAEDGKERWLLIGAPLLMIPWVNIHGGFIYGPALIGLYALCKVPAWLRQWKGGTLTPRPRYVLGALGLAAVACLANPNGIEGAVYPLEYVAGGHTWHQSVITEYESPNFSGRTFAILGYLIVATMATLAASGRRSTLWDVALTAIFLYTALKWQRNAALFAFAVAPVLALHAGDLLDRVSSSARRPATDREPSRLVAWTILAALVVSMAVSVPSAARRADEVFRGDMPVECVQYIKDNGIEGRMFNTYRWGGYLTWHLWPEQQVMVDGRADVLGRELVMDWQRAHQLDEGWEQVLDDYEIDWAIISAGAPLARALDLHPKWRLACEEETARLFVRADSVADRTAGPRGTQTD
ncbi:MAG: hypothetical protein R6V07_08395 [Armatimonadota bacterium]